MLLALERRLCTGIAQERLLKGVLAIGAFVQVHGTCAQNRVGVPLYGCPYVGARTHLPPVACLLLDEPHLIAVIRPTLDTSNPKHSFQLR